MSNQRITQLNSLNSGSLLPVDVFLVVDVPNAETKNVTLGNLSSYLASNVVINSASHAIYADDAGTCDNADSASLATLAKNANTASVATTSGTASFCNTSISSSYAATASSVPLQSIVNLANTASYLYPGTLYVTTVTMAQSSSFATTASYIKTSVATASFALLANTASYTLLANTASYVRQAVSSSFASTAVSASVVKSGSNVIAAWCIFNATASVAGNNIPLVASYNVNRVVCHVNPGQYGVELSFTASNRNYCVQYTVGDDAIGTYGYSNNSSTVLARTLTGSTVFDQDGSITGGAGENAPYNSVMFIML